MTAAGPKIIEFYKNCNIKKVYIFIHLTYVRFIHLFHLIYVRF